MSEEEDVVEKRTQVNWKLEGVTEALLTSFKEAKVEKPSTQDGTTLTSGQWKLIYFSA